MLCLAAAHAAPKFQEIDGIVSAETENAAKITSWTEHSDGAASGGKFMEAQKKKCSSCTMDFPIHFSQTGYYRIYIRCKSTGTDDNDAYMTLDGVGGYVQDGDSWRGPVEGIKTNHRSWGWESQAKHGSDTPSWASRKPVYVQVKSAGEHTFKIGSRSADFKIDKLVLVKQGNSFKPSDKGPAETLYGQPTAATQPARQIITTTDGISISQEQRIITVSSDKSGLRGIFLFNALGVRTAAYNPKGAATFSTPAALPAGVYFVKVVSAKRRHVSRITIR
jgi:hypothetical protein